MKLFKEINGTCFICGTSNPGKVVLIPIDGTEEVHIVQAEQVHLDCLNLRLHKDDTPNIIYQLIETPEQ